MVVDTSQYWFCIDVYIQSDHVPMIDLRNDASVRTCKPEMPLTCKGNNFSRLRLLIETNHSIKFRVFKIFDNKMYI